MSLFLPFAVVAGIAVLGCIALVLIYNSLVVKRNNVDNAFACIDAQLKKRYDLIPNLVETVKNYMKHEASTLKDIAEMRSRAISGNLNQSERAELDKRLGSAIGGIMVSVENYPDLKASDNFQQLQRTLNETEEQLSAARRAFNAAVTDYNNAIQIFPYSIIAGIGGFTAKTLFEASGEERSNPNVGQLFKS
ncbi:MAG: hypothetical protein A2X49_11370 [Lentisphaerae bacterium GWF2_52_8]|nr:MAG: hypothetical protein A2X49_11370 [Lentisphaerae bacterium GWF2_52_8]